MTYLDNMKSVGSKCEATQDLDIADIAKLVRKEIKAGVKSGSLPAALRTSVRISRYSMGQSLSVTITELGTLGANPARVKWDMDNPHAYPGEAPHRYTAVAVETIEALEAMVKAYNYDDSDSQTDYYNVRFSGSVSIDHDVTNLDKKAIKESGGYPDLSPEAAERRAEANEAIEVATAAVAAIDAGSQVDGAIAAIKAINAASDAVANINPDQFPKLVIPSGVPAIPVIAMFGGVVEAGQC